MTTSTHHYVAGRPADVGVRVLVGGRQCVLVGGRPIATRGRGGRRALQASRSAGTAPDARGPYPGCAQGERPCQRLRCRYHLGSDVRRPGSLPRVSPRWAAGLMHECCALDVARRGPLTLEQIGALLGVSRERVRQIEVAALAKMRALAELAAGRDDGDGDVVAVLHLAVASFCLDRLACEWPACGGSEPTGEVVP